MRKTISSPFTIFLKFIWPSIWFACGLSFIASFFSAPLTPKAVNLLLGIILIWLPGAILCYWKQFPLKKVGLDNGFLYVSNYIKEIKIPLSNIADIKEVRGIFNMPRYTILLRLKTSSAFGEKIRFVPGFYIKDVVRQLRDAVNSMP